MRHFDSVDPRHLYWTRWYERRVVRRCHNGFCHVADRTSQDYHFTEEWVLFEENFVTGQELYSEEVF